MPHPYDDFLQLEENLWTVEGSIPRLPIKRRMTVIRLSDGRLVFHSPMMLSDDDMALLEGLGEPAFALVPNGYHRLGGPKYKKRYPNLQVIAPERSAKRVSEVVEVNGFYDALPEDAALTVETLDGGKVGEGVLIVSSEAGKTLVFNDPLFNVQQVKGGFSRFVVRLVGSYGGPKVTPTAKFFLIKDKKALRAHFERLAKLDGLHRLIPGHGDIIHENAAEALKAVASKL